MVAIQVPAEQRVMLHNIDWETYERVLAAHTGRSTPRITYDRGEVELMSPQSEHERLNRAMQLLVPVAGSMFGVKVYSLGSTTFRRRDIRQGFEPDSCFYLGSTAVAQGQRALDSEEAPPPDLVVEADITSPSIAKLPLYAAFGVPEVWRYDAAGWRILLREGEQYREPEASQALSGVTPAALTDVLGDSRGLDDMEWMERVREWALTLRRTPG